MLRIITTTTIALLSALVVAGGVSATAFAAAPEFSPAKGSFTSKSGKAKLLIKGGSAIECTASTGKGEITGAKTATSEIKFTGCKVGGLAVLSMVPPGAKEEVVTPTINQELCYLTMATRSVGMINTFSAELKAEVPITKRVIGILGAAIGEMLPVNTKVTNGKMTLTQAAGVEGIEKCEGGTAKTLLSKEGAGAYTQSGLEIADEIKYATATEVTA